VVRNAERARPSARHADRGGGLPLRSLAYEGGPGCARCQGQEGVCIAGRTASLSWTTTFQCACLQRGVPLSALLGTPLYAPTWLAMLLRSILQRVLTVSSATAWILARSPAHRRSIPPLHTVQQRRLCRLPLNTLLEHTAHADAQPDDPLLLRNLNDTWR
jgi:hypothetical protein